jgi:hypothetical protein
MLSLVISWSRGAIVQILFRIVSHILSINKQLACILKVTSILVRLKSVLLWFWRWLAIINIYMVGSPEGCLIKLIASLRELVKIHWTSSLRENLLCLIKLWLCWFLFFYESFNYLLESFHSLLILVIKERLCCIHGGGLLIF